MGKVRVTEVVGAYVDTKEAARLLGYTLQHTRLLIRTGQLKAIKFGRDWMIERKSIADFSAQRSMER